MEQILSDVNCGGEDQYQYVFNLHVVKHFIPRWQTNTGIFQHVTKELQL